MNKTVHATLYSADKLAGLQETLAPQQEESLETSQPEPIEEKAITEIVLTQKIAPKKELQDPPKKPVEPKKLAHNQNKVPKNKSTQNMHNKDSKIQLTNQVPHKPESITRQNHYSAQRQIILVAL